MFPDYCDGCRQDYEDLLKTLNKGAPSCEMKKTFIVFLNYRNGCMQDYEDVLKRAPSCEMSVRWSADGSAQPLNESHIAGLLV